MSPSHAEMTRTRSNKAELTESWDDMNDSYEDRRQIYDEEEERDEVGDEYFPQTYRSQPPREAERDTPRRRSTRSSVEPELVMPASPDGGRQRASTPHMRMNKRSLTSDAGVIRQQRRSSTPRQRMGDRSMTSDAGRLKRSRLQEHSEADYESEEEAGGQARRFVWQSIARPLLVYSGGVVGIMLEYLMPLIAFSLTIYLIIAAILFGAGFINNSLNNALSPICRLPFTGNLPFCPSVAKPELKGNVEFHKLVKAQDTFEDILASTAVGVNLPIGMKQSEASIRDLKQVVQYSELPSKNELVFEFSGFIDTARQASTDLSRFNSRIGRAVDSILSTNRWTLSVIDGVTVSDASKGAIPKWIGENLNIFAPFQPVSLSRDLLLDQYLRHTNAVEEQITSLITEAIALRTILDNLDGRVDIINEIVVRDGVKITNSKDELFATLWSRLGGNRATVSRLNKQIELLNDVARYRRLAWGHVTATLLKLQEIQYSLEDLRERVALPETVGTAKIPLEVHISSINMGIERLEKQRDASKRVEAETLARVLRQAEQQPGKREIEGGEKKEL